MGTLAGRILDEQGRPLAGADIVLRSRELDTRYETSTDTEGNYTRGGLRPGRYFFLLLREGEIIFSFPITLPPYQELLRLDFDLKKLRLEAEERARLSPDLQERLQAEQARLTREHRLRAFYNRGARLLQEENFSEAIETYQRALEEEPYRGATYSTLGTALAGAGRTEEALAAYRRALALEPNEAAHHNNLGKLLVERGQLEEATAQFRQAARLDPPRAALYHFNLGAALLNAGRADEALAPLRNATRQDPTLAVAHFFFGVALFRGSAEPGSLLQGEPRFANRAVIISAFHRYLQLEPEGEFATQARDYLDRLGAGPPEMLLPSVPQAEDLP